LHDLRHAALTNLAGPPPFRRAATGAFCARLRSSWRNVAASHQWGTVGEAHLVGGRGGNGERSQLPRRRRRLPMSPRGEMLHMPTDHQPPSPFPSPEPPPTPTPPIPGPDPLPRPDPQPPDPESRATVRAWRSDRCSSASTTRAITSAGASLTAGAEPLASVGSSSGGSQLAGSAFGTRTRSSTR
jgi:hypothetical protein